MQSSLSSTISRIFERARLIEQYHDKEHECVSATVQKVEPATQNAILTIDKNEVYLVRNEQIPGETLKAGDIIKVYVVGISQILTESLLSRYQELTESLLKDF